jgi:hypothetical protein
MISLNDSRFNLCTGVECVTPEIDLLSRPQGNEMVSQFSVDLTLKPPEDIEKLSGIFRSKRARWIQSIEVGQSLSQLKLMSHCNGETIV